jgi:group I intron endonuclease
MQANNDNSSYSNVAGVYQIRNAATGDLYIGSATNIANRWAVHKYQLRKGTHGNRNLQTAWNEYDHTCFEFSVLAIVEDRAGLVPAEQSYFDLLKPSFNIAPNAGSCAGLKFSDERKKQISERVKGSGNYWFGKRLPCQGASKRLEVRAKMSARHSGKGNPMHGVTPPHAKLTDDQVREIRALLANGEELRPLAERYNVSKGAIAHIKQGRTYRRVI